MTLLRVSSEQNYTIERDLSDLKCPHCHESNQNLKRYEVLEFCLFLLFITDIDTANYTACPKCMRKHLRWTLIVNILPGNILWPVYVLPRALMQIVMSYSSGVSPSIRHQIAQAEIEK